MGETSEYNTIVDSSKILQNGEKFITEETVEGKDKRHKVMVSVYRVGEEEKIFPPGVYYLIRKDGREVLISQGSFEAFLDS